MEYSIVFNLVKSKLMCLNSVSSDKPPYCVVSQLMSLIMICI